MISAHRLKGSPGEDLLATLESQQDCSTGSDIALHPKRRWSVKTRAIISQAFAGDKERYGVNRVRLELRDNLELRTAIQVEGADLSEAGQVKSLLNTCRSLFRETFKKPVQPADVDEEEA